ncbi:LamG-like jellyroll fold domain-containing protein [Halopseudomonas salegens]|uniref:LamG-like jellyroll fold domain-containing protein n=1 Tax=Halopseudomonas salegens TaxID=1434072 RepID=UPI0012FE1744|nr:LamG-like jellyroll fold domain-containing protein [Halopseudomonas salegens]
MNHPIRALVALLCLFSATSVWAQGTALDFDGDDDYVTLAALPDQWTTLLDDGFTVTLRVQPKDIGTTQRLFFIQEDTDNVATAMINSLGQVYFIIRHDGTYYSRYSQLNVANDTWTDLAFVWGSNSSQVSIWLDGQDSTALLGGSTSMGADNTFTLGSRSDGDQTLNGVLDNVRIWDSALDASTINLIANNYCLQADIPLHAYDFEVGTPGADNTGLNTLPDLIGSNPGTLSGFDLTGNRSNWVEGERGACADFDYALTSTVSQAVVAPADQLTWSATLSSDTLVPGDLLPDVEIVLPLPAGLLFDSLISDPAFSCTTPPVGASGSLSCAASGLIAPGTYAFDVTTSVEPAALPNTAYTAEWRVVQPTSDRLGPNNTSADVARVNNLLLLVDDDVTVNPSSPYIDVLANDSDAPGGPGLDVASLALSQAASNGTASCAAGVCRYKPDSTFVGTDSFRYRVCDVGTPQVCGEAEVRIEVILFAVPVTGPLAWLMMVLLVSGAGAYRLKLAGLPTPKG